jgi:hypothetical protein
VNHVWFLEYLYSTGDNFVIGAFTTKETAQTYAEVEYRGEIGPWLEDTDDYYVTYAELASTSGLNNRLNVYAVKLDPEPVAGRRQ